MTRFPAFTPVADAALLVELGDAEDDALNRAVIALDAAIRSADIVGVIETVPALVSLLVVFDPLLTDHAAIRAAVSARFPVRTRKGGNAPRHRIPVCYDPELCPDLPAVAEATGLSVDAVVEAHLSAELRVAMYGFAPGYAYLTGLPARIRVPRKPTAVRDVPKGSVIIAGPQCLLTTLTMPTGWSIIGRTPAQVMEGGGDGGFLFDVGDIVTFARITRAELPVEMQEP